MLSYLCDVLLEYLCVRCLRISKVHKLIQKFVADHKIVPNTLLFYFFEILSHHLAMTFVLTRPGVDKVKPKVWFKYSLWID